MERRDLGVRIAGRVVQAGLVVPDAALDLLAGYLGLLARWNERVNLTGFALASPTDEAIDRLLVEPLIAARRILPEDRLLVDIGSGGGSPAIPLRIMAPWLRVVLVESKARKCAFLREAVRQLELSGVAVENRRVEDLASRPDFQGSADVVTIRAVRADDELWGSVRLLLKRGGRVLWLTTPAVLEAGTLPGALRLESTEELVGADGGRLVVLSIVS